MMMMMIGACLSFLWARKPARYDAIWGSWPGQFQLWRQQVTPTTAAATSAKVKLCGATKAIRLIGVSVGAPGEIHCLLAYSMWHTCFFLETI